MSKEVCNNETNHDVLDLMISSNLYINNNRQDPLKLPLWQEIPDKSPDCSILFIKGKFFK